MIETKSARMQPTGAQLRWVAWQAARLAAIFLLELIFGAAFYVSSIAGAVAGGYLAGYIPDWHFLRRWDAAITIAITLAGATIGGGAWLSLRYGVIQKALRWIGLAKTPRTPNLSTDK